MFKIESYITPLILDHLSKYLKNFKEEDYSVKLWSGTLQFQNLDLRLDVIEEELQLPFTFLSGHIHNLEIHVPWTQISSEPITITINTIELVLKLKDFNDINITKLKPKKPVAEEVPGYISSLIHKVINNISIVCRNIVLKYVEDDSIMSCNIQYLSVHSCDMRWRKAFLDVSPTNVLFRKLINIIDLTICMDSRNSAGKIEYIQQPILYKCSMEIRLFRKFNTIAPKISSVTRIDLHTTCLNLNISSQQISMLIRFFDLVMALKSGKLQGEATNLTNEGSLEAIESQNISNTSYLMWFWESLPTIFSIEDSIENSGSEDRKIFELGMFVDEIKLAFKTQEILNDSIVPAAKKVFYKSLLEISLQEVYSNLITCGSRKMNVSFGISYVEARAIDDCCCGSKLQQTVLMNSGSNKKTRNHLKDSFFVEVKDATIPHKYESMWINYEEKQTENVLLAKTPAIAMDIIHLVVIPEDAASSDFGEDYEFSNFTETYSYRLILNQLNLKVNSDSIHRIEKLMSYYNDYMRNDYLPYFEEKPPLTRSQLQVASAEDYDALINEVPTKQIQFHIKDLTIEFYPWVHNKNSKIKKKSSLECKTAEHNRVNAIPTENPQISPTPFLVLLVRDVKHKTLMPIYPNRLLHTACQLPDQKNELFNQCFLTMSFDIEDLTISFKEKKPFCFVKSVHGSFKNLIQPNLWEDNVQQKIFKLKVGAIDFTANSVQLFTIMSISKSLICHDVEYIIDLDDVTLMKSIDVDDRVTMQIILKSIDLTYAETSTTRFGKVNLKKISGFAFHPKSAKKKSLMVNWPDITGMANLKDYESVLLVTVQFPKDHVAKNAPLVSVLFSDGAIRFDPMLQEFFKWEFLKRNDKKDMKSVNNISKSTKKTAVQKMSINENAPSKRSLAHLPTVHSSSECDVTICQTVDLKPTIDETCIMHWYSLCHLLVFNINVNSMTVYLTNDLEPSIFRTIAESIEQQNNSPSIVIKLPNILIFSSSGKNLADLEMENFPFLVTGWSEKKSLFPWSLSLTNLSCYYFLNDQVISLLEPITTCVTLAISTKDNDKDSSSIDSTTGLSVYFHIDTTPITANFYKDQIILMKAFLETISNVVRPFKSDLEEVTLPTNIESTHNSAEIKDFLGLPNSCNTATTKNSISEENLHRKIHSRINSWFQWTCSKISIKIYDKEVQSSNKLLVLDIEDIMFSMDQQDVYFKIKAKVVGVCGEFFEKNVGDDKWMKNYSLNLTVQSEESDSKKNTETFLDVIVTKAETGNVHSKWGTFKKNRSLNESLTEIIVNIQQIDLILNFDELLFFQPILSELTKTKETSTSFATTSSSFAGVSNLPLFHLKSNGFRIFVPSINECNSPADVIILKVNQLSISNSSVENPICRIPLRPELYTKAAQLRILNIPGSKIEDRQYELTMEISLSTSNWKEIVGMMIGETVPQNYDNPAFEWNNLQNIQKFQNFNVQTIFHEFKFSAIYAPCINFKGCFVCGAALEFNCISDIELNFGVIQLALGINIMNQIQSFIASTSIIDEKTELEMEHSNKENIHEESLNSNWSERRLQKSLSFTDKKSFDDSGVDSLSYSNKKFNEKRSCKRKTSSRLSNKQAVPYEIGFVSGKFTIKCIDITIHLEQPNILISQSAYEKTTQMSLFDLKVSMDQTEKNLLFHTKQGELDSLGISQPLIKMKYTNSQTTDLEVQVKRPIKVDFSHTNFQKVMVLMVKVQKHIVKKSNITKKEIIAVNLGKKITVIKSYLKGIDNFDLTSSQLVIDLKVVDLYEFSMFCSSFKSKLKVYDRPEKIEFSTEVNSLTLRHKDKIALHPLTLQLKVRIVQPYWKKDPLVHINISSYYLRFDLHAVLVNQVLLMQQEFLKVLTLFKKEAKEIDKNPLRVIKEKLIPLPTQNAHFEELHRASIEHYQDDLRAGAFQFVESNSLKDLPLPYQIQIVNRDVGIICWRYPQPRALNKIKTFPIPFHTSRRLFIPCKVEYYSSLKSCFEDFCEFSLSEMDTKWIELDNDRVSAEIWRIKIPQLVIKRDSDDDEDESDDLQFKVHPKVLVGCLRVDSYFASNAIPSLDLFMDISKVDVNIFNEIPQALKVPDLLKSFKLADEKKVTHLCIKNHINALKMYGQFFDDQLMNFEVDASFNADIIDFKACTFVALVDSFSWKVAVGFANEKLNINILTDQIPIKFGPSIGHALYTAQAAWERNLAKEANGVVGIEAKEMIIYSRYIICNNTVSPIGFGQEGTNEMICLVPKTCKLYSFRTEKLEEKLEFAVCNLKNEWTSKSKSISLSIEAVQYVKFIDEYLVVTIKIISSTQKLITVDGQTTIVNMSKEFFRVQYKYYHQNVTNSDNCANTDFDLSAKINQSVFGKCLNNSQQSIRLKITAEKKGWSGEIPLQEIVRNNRPWLVKVPSSIKGGHTSFWVRILRETVISEENSINRVLVIIWPLFMLKSMLTVSTTANEEKIDQNYSIFGRGAVKEFEMSGTDENEHELTFRMDFSSNSKTEDKRKITMSYNFIDKGSFFKIPDEYSNISHAIDTLQKPVLVNWPCSREEELRLHRENSFQESTMPVYQFAAHPPEDLSCSLMLTLAPWTLFINSTACLVKLVNFVDKNSCFVAANDTVMPFFISDSFIISIKLQTDWLESEPIYINAEVKKSISNSYVIPVEDGKVYLTLHTETEVVHLLLTSVFEDHSRVLILSSAFVVSNYTDFDLQIWPFAVQSNDRVELQLKNQFEDKNYQTLHCNGRKSTDVMGNPINSFKDLSKSKGKHKSKGCKGQHSFYVSLSYNGIEFSCPIYLDKMTPRKCFNMRIRDRSVPLCVTIVKHQDQTFLAIHEDFCPFLLVRNETDFNLYVAQTDLANPNPKSVLPHKESIDDRFLWYQMVLAKQSVFYTPPVVNDAFPEILNTEFGVVFACASADNIKWSQPIKVDENKKIIIIVPSFGELKLCINTLNKTAELTINYLEMDRDSHVSNVQEKISNPTSNPDFNIPAKDKDYCQNASTLTSPKLTKLENHHKKTYMLSSINAKKRQLNLRVFFQGISLTLLKNGVHRNVDVVSFNIGEVQIEYLQKSNLLNIRFASFQIDNLLHPSGEYDYPVVMCNKDIPKLSKSITSSNSAWDLEKIFKISQVNPISSIHIQFYDNNESHLDVETLVLNLCSIRLYIEDTFVNVLLDLMDECIPSNLVYKSNFSIKRISCQNGLVLIPKTVVCQSLAESIRIRSIRIAPLNVLLSIHTCIRLYIALDHSPLYFSAYEKQNVYTVPIKFGNSIGMHYLSSALFGVGWVVGSLEILGSPSGLARSFTSGLKDFVSMPVQGAFNGPWGFIVGLTQGSISLIKNVSTGTVNSVTKLAASVSRNLDRLTMDSEHISYKIDALRRNRPQGVSDGFAQGLTGFGISLLGAVAGLSRHPLSGKSTFEVVTGVGKGIMGIFTKPISGAAELVALTGQGMLQSVGYNTLPMPMNLFLTDNKTLLPLVEKIIEDQLPQLLSQHLVLYSCKATFIRKNDLKNAMIILLSNAFVILDLDVDSVYDIIRLEKIAPVGTDASNDADHSNLFSFKLKEEVKRKPKNPENSENMNEYKVSSRTRQYVLDTSGYQSGNLMFDYRPDNYDSDSSNSGSRKKSVIPTSNVTEDVTEIQSGSKNCLSFFINDEFSGKYLCSYVMLLKQDLNSKDQAFPMFDLQ